MQQESNEYDIANAKDIIIDEELGVVPGVVSSPSRIFLTLSQVIFIFLCHL